MPDFDILIIGAGISGSTLAALLAPHASLALVDRDIAAIPGSTGHAPGVVAQINSIPALAELAHRSVGYYSRVPGGFDNVGGLEVALGNEESLDKETRDKATLEMEARAALAHSLGLPAEVLSATQAAALAPAFVRADAAGAVHFPSDGLCDAKTVTRANVARAREAGATLIDGDVTSIDNGGGWRVALTTATGPITLTARHVVVCTGAWGGQLLPRLASAAVPVAHPYVFGQRRAPRAAEPAQQHDLVRPNPGPAHSAAPTQPAPSAPARSPFVRFPAHGVYVREHADRDGLGSYAHPVERVMSAALRAQSSGVVGWSPRFDAWMDSSSTVLPDATARLFHGPRVGVPRNTAGNRWTLGHDVPHGFAGLMAMTPDGMPLCGRIKGGPDGAMWVLVGAWVTHAAGCAGVLAPQILAALGKGGMRADDAWLRAALDPMRFEGVAEGEREKLCLDKYADIWNRKDTCVVRIVRPPPRQRAKM